MSPTRVLRPALAALAVLALSASPGLAADPIPFEIGISAREAGHVRALLEKLSKQNVLYQFRLGGISKQQMQETAAQIDRVIATLEKGSPTYSVAPLVTKAVLEQIHALDAEWGRLRRLALASPYDYLRYGSDLMPKRSRIGDPFSIQVFDDMTRATIAEADELQRMIVAQCNETGYEFCDAASQSGFFNMHVQRIAKQLVLLYAGIEIEGASIDDLRGNRDRLEAALTALGASPILVGASEASRGRQGIFVSTLWGSIQEGWGQVRFEVDLALEGRVDGLDIQRMLKVQRALVDELDRIRAALSRYAQAKLEA